jgi:hypothetical protein
MFVIGPFAHVGTEFGHQRLGHRGPDAVHRHASHPGDPQAVARGGPAGAF